MGKKIDWKKVLKIETLRKEGNLPVSEIARKMKLHRRQVQRNLEYAERPDYPHRH